jgi:hypothetical protein
VAKVSDFGYRHIVAVMADGSHDTYACTVPKGAYLDVGDRVLIGRADRDSYVTGNVVSEVMYVPDDLVKLLCILTHETPETLKTIKAKVEVTWYKFREEGAEDDERTEA